MDINDLSTTEQDAGAVVNLRDAAGNLELFGPGGKKKQLTVTVAGQYSKRYKKALKERTDRNLKRRDFQVDSDGLEDASRELQAAAILAWDFTANGKPLPITATNWNAILAKRPEFEAQVQRGIDEYASFFVKPSAT